MTDLYRPHHVEWTPEKIGRFWDDYGSDESHGPAYFSFHAGRAIVARADHVVGLQGRRVLDFGSGRGDLLAHLLALGIHATGLEFSERSADVARERFAAEPLFEGVEVTSSLPSALRDASLDVVFLVEVLEHLLDEHLGATLDEVRRVLVPGGFVVATTPSEEDLAGETVRCPDCGAAFHRWQHVRSFSTGSISELFAEHGFDERLVEETHWNPPRLTRVRRFLGRGGRPPHLLYVGVRRDGGR